MMSSKKQSRFAFPELFEFNWRLWSFVLLLLMSGAVLFLNPVSPYLGYTDPFYSPTVLVIPVVALFRITCYAYRKDYYRHVFKHPLACKADIRGEKENRPYSGERSFFALNNFHRYFLYVGVALLPFFYYDFYISLVYYSGYFTLRLGSIILLANALLLTLWTVSCHAFRHLTGGHIECYSCKVAPNFRKKFYLGQSFLNAFHEDFAFISLAFVIAVDIYIRALIVGLPIDYTFFKVLI
ncbi:MAG: hypothetical protein M1148_00445 [Candidatus Thermoplasmatota archaeon]|nr:hypothetical protein [Candidatus Thermoplasmatota archaeon]